jgi:hypothetical protein
MQKVIMRVEELPIPGHFSQGDYQDDPVFRKEVQNWVWDIWTRKDRLMDACLTQKRTN